MIKVFSDHLISPSSEKKSVEKFGLTEKKREGKSNICKYTEDT